MLATIDAKAASQITSLRDLTTYLTSIWNKHFADVARVNDIQIGYGYPWKGRLGLIRLSSDEGVSFIGINTLLQLPQVPECVLVTTIAHELVHYAHGFGSPLPRPYKHPHANKVVDRELEHRQLGQQLRSCNEWIDKYWYPFYDTQHATGCVSTLAARRAARQVRDSQC